MKKIIYRVLLVLLFVAVVVGVKFYNAIMIMETYKSPDGQYELVIKREHFIPLTTMPGDGGYDSASVEVILKNANGDIIGKSSTNSDCGVFKFSIYVDWDIENNQVWYARAKTINLTTGKVEC